MCTGRDTGGGLGLSYPLEISELFVTFSANSNAPQKEKENKAC